MHYIDRYLGDHMIFGNIMDHFLVNVLVLMYIVKSLQYDSVRIYHIVQEMKFGYMKCMTRLSWINVLSEYG